MNVATQDDMVVGLDIGTSKVVAIVGAHSPQGLEIIGLGSHPSKGLKKGVVVDIDSTVQSIQCAIEEAELMADCDIRSVHVGIAGSHVKGMNSSGVVAIRGGEVDEHDDRRVIDAAQAVSIPSDQEVLHVLTQDYRVDDQEGVRQPQGLSGVRLEANVHLVTCARTAIQNIEKCINRAGRQVDKVVLEQLASSHAVLTEEEREQGVCLVDIGHGTTDIAVFIGGAMCHTGVIPVAGYQVTGDIATALRTPTHHADDLKLQYACALASLTRPEETIQVPGVGDRAPREMSRQVLAEAVEQRYEELFGFVQKQLRSSGYEERLTAGVVLTGGSSRMEGAVELAEEVFHMPVRLGLPRDLRGLKDIVANPIYATGVGLLKYATEHTPPPRTRFAPTGMADWFGRVKNWVKGNF
ncbi:MAG: cell division protein FtsA [Cellvibrionales bacterium]|nr:cell division protein FtsA [Cellvibrionales bacterium]